MVIKPIKYKNRAEEKHLSQLFGAFPHFFGLKFVSKAMLIVECKHFAKTINKGSMPNKHNQAQVELLKEKVAKAKALAIIDYSGTTANDQVALRQAIKEVGGEMYVSKNTLIDIAIGKGQLSDSLSGMNAVIFSYQDEVSALKKLFEFAKDHEQVNIKQGYLTATDSGAESKVLSPAETEALSKLPGKNELIVMLMNTIKAPASGLVNVMKAGTRDLVNVLHAIAKKDN